MFDRLGRIEDETPFVLEAFVKAGVERWSVCEGQQKIENHTDTLMNYIRFWQAAGIIAFLFTRFLRFAETQGTRVKIHALT